MHLIGGMGGGMPQAVGMGGGMPLMGSKGGGMPQAESMGGGMPLMGGLGDGAPDDSDSDFDWDTVRKKIAIDNGVEEVEVQRFYDSKKRGKGKSGV